MVNNELVENKMKKLPGFANNLSAMTVNESASELYEKLIDLPDGTVIINPSMLIAQPSHVTESIQFTIWLQLRP